MTRNISPPLGSILMEDEAELISYFMIDLCVCTVRYIEWFRGACLLCLRQMI